MRRASEVSDGGTPSSPPSSPEDHPAKPYRHRRRRPHAPTSRSSQISFAHRGISEPDAPKDQTEGGSEDKAADADNHSHDHGHARHHGLISQVVGWLHEERKRRTTRRVKFHRRASHKGLHPAHHKHDEHHGAPDEADAVDESDASSGSVALDRLERILANTPGLEKLGLPLNLRPRPGRKTSEKSTRRSARTPKLHHASSSDTDYFGQEVFVPDCQLILGDAKTLGQVTAGSSASRDSAGGELELGPESKEWRQFKDDIIRVTHTLGIKGWRRVPLDGGTDIGVERLSGALTNAVYVVSPPRTLKSESSQNDLATPNPVPKRHPP